MSGFKEFNRITTDYAEVLNVLFKDFIQFVALQYKSKLINSNDIEKLIDSESHNDLSKTLNKYKQPLWQHKDLREGKFSLSMLLSQYNKLSYIKQNASIIQFIDAQEIGPRRINKICLIATSLLELRNKIAHGYYVKDEAEAAMYWSNLAQLVMSYPPKFIKRDDIRQKFADMDNFIKGDLLNSWISFYQPEEEESNVEENNSLSPQENTIDEIVMSAISDVVEIMENHNDEVLRKITEIQNQPSLVKVEEEIEDAVEDDDYEETPLNTKSEEQLTESEAISQLVQLKDRIHKEMRFKHNKKMANWECIAQWNIIHAIIAHLPKNKDEFKKLDAFQHYYNSEQSKRATEADKVNARSVMNFQVDEYWDEILEIIEKTSGFILTKK